MPLAVLVARRIGMMRLMVIGAGFGVAANICFATAATPYIYILAAFMASGT
jgi:SET family sugar efflux transporter-like MFS transporter